MTLRPENRLPSGSILNRVREDIHRLIETQKMNAGAKLPSERLMAENNNCTRITLREALIQLEYEGYIYSKIRQGWFIAPAPLLYDPTRRVIFSKLVAEQNREGKTTLIHGTKTKNIGDDVRAAFGFAKNASAIEIVRCRFLEGRAILLEEIYLDATRFSGLLDLDMELSLSGHLSQTFGVEITMEDTRIRASALDAEKAHKLSVAQSTPCLALTRSRKDSTGTCIEFNREYWLSNAVEIRIAGRT